jgi:hypothetical protein
VSGSLLQDVNSLNFDNIIFSRILPIEGIELYSYFSDAEMKALQKDKAFMRIWEGGIMRGPLEIRSMVGEDDKGRLTINGRRFTLSSWDWQPPFIIRYQGRLAKEFSDPRNNHPEIAIETERGETLWLDACPCGGELLMDERDYLYCVECNMIY